MYFGFGRLAKIACSSFVWCSDHLDLRKFWYNTHERWQWSSLLCGIKLALHMTSRISSKREVLIFQILYAHSKYCMLIPNTAQLLEIRK